MFMLGYAYQRGLVPITAEAIDQAIELNGAAQQMNRESFLWGRRTAVDRQAVENLIAARQDAARASLAPAPIEDLAQAIAWRRQFLVDYQNAAYAQRYTALVDRVERLERQHFPGRTALTRAVAQYHFKLMAIKDEYEVARLHADSGFLASVAQRFEGDYRLVFNLAPPLLARRDPATGAPRKREFGAWVVPVFRLLAKMRFLRGSAFDLFGRTQERRMERQLLADYEQRIAQVLDTLQTTGDPAHHEAAVALASLPEQIRGYGHVRARSVAAAKQRETALLAALQRRVIPLRKAA
jgi:indolepyruvate ferredoxin oxidoreductase